MKGDLGIIEQETVFPVFTEKCLYYVDCVNV